MPVSPVLDAFHPLWILFMCPIRDFLPTVQAAVLAASCPDSHATGAQFGSPEHRSVFRVSCSTDDLRQGRAFHCFRFPCSLVSSARTPPVCRCYQIPIFCLARFGLRWQLHPAAVLSPGSVQPLALPDFTCRRRPDLASPTRVYPVTVPVLDLLPLVSRFSSAVRVTVFHFSAASESSPNRFGLDLQTLPLLVRHSVLAPLGLCRTVSCSIMLAPVRFCPSAGQGHRRLIFPLRT
jgi:hypothetical protein